MSLGLTWPHHCFGMFLVRFLKVRLGNFLRLIRVPRMALLTCREPHFSGHKTQLHDGELRQLQFVHSGHSTVPSLPEEHNVVCGVSICREYTE